MAFKITLVVYATVKTEDDIKKLEKKLASEAEDFGATDVDTDIDDNEEIDDEE